MWISRIEKISPEDNEIIIETRSWGDLIVPPDKTFGFFLFGEILKLASKKKTFNAQLKKFLLAYELTGILEVPKSFEDIIQWEIIEKGTYLWNENFGAFNPEIKAGKEANSCIGKITFIKKVDFSSFLTLEKEFIQFEACYFSIVEPNLKASPKPSDNDLWPILIHKKNIKVETEGFYPFTIWGYLWGFDLPDQKKGWLLAWVEKKKCHKRKGNMEASRVWIDDFTPKAQSEILKKIKTDPRYPAPKPKLDDELQTWKRWKQILDEGKMDISQLAFKEGISKSKIKLGLMKLGKL